ncbi:pyridoxal phosphate-dependent transferase [Ilyonectria robusta]|uniref:pyridoxal phosphate-dependent transferase n=1 Tax=Ilyonectria robusta TaxID=1079257 RepID=UPI001E8E064E|nr:pyridoxal phosphate-dependent transferase [Ilyonectria robusta]KAH8694450.1 pyridoxal phosphate-dependent transferase [Ilyonectria robusta]
MSRQSHIFHRSLSKDYPTAAAGQGVYIISPDGTKILDGSSGAAVSCLGHGNPDVIAAIIEQAQRMAFAHSSFFTSDPAEELASLLIDSSHGAFSKVLFLSSGSEAVESAFKLARQYHLCNGDPGRVNIISRQFSYHGNTIGALSAGFNPPRRQPFKPLLSPAFHHVSPCFFSRDASPDESEQDYVKRLIKEYEDMFTRLGPETVAAVIVEPVGGSTLGAVPAASGYLAQLRELCDKHGSLLIFDEVMCGMGRVGTLHAWQSLGSSAPDIQTIGKGLGAGYQPISGILISPKVHDTLKSSQATNPFVNGHTYQGHSIACAAALATQRTIVKNNLLSNVRQMGDLLFRKLKTLTPHLKEVRGLGLFLAVEFSSKPTAHIAPEVAQACFKNGAAVYLCSAAVDSVMFAPPFIINETEINELVDIFLRSVNEVLERKGESISSI